MSNKKQYINFEYDNFDANPITFKLYELKILHNMLVESLEKFPDYPQDVIILNKIAEEIYRTDPIPANVEDYINCSDDDLPF
jgi:hypothetical protein